MVTPPAWGLEFRVYAVRGEDSPQPPEGGTPNGDGAGGAGITRKKFAGRNHPPGEAPLEPTTNSYGYTNR
jgi:hypothetical protein